MKKLFVDANILMRVIVGKEYNLLKYLVGTEPYTSTPVLEEAAYKIIALSILEATGGTISVYKIKKSFERGVAEDLVKARLSALNKLVEKLKEKLNVIPPTLEDFEVSKEIVIKFRLFPNDTLIATIMQRKNIDLLLTLDSDFNEYLGLK